MISELARRDADKLRDKGVTLSLEECVRLNSLGLAVEHSARLHQPYLLPRVAIVEGLVLREPSLAQQVWLDDYLRIVDSMDNVTTLCVSAFAYSTPPDKLPDITDPEACLKAVAATYDKIKSVGIRALASALNYIALGTNGADGEYAPRPRGEKQPEIREEDDVSIALGILLDGTVLRLGITLSEARKLTRSQIEEIRDEAISASLIEKGVTPEAINDSRRKNRHREYLRYFDMLRKRAENGR